MKKVYYAHSLHLYNTPQEKRDVELLENLGYEVLNPNSEEVASGFQEFRKTVDEFKYMQYFEDLVKKCDVVAFRRHVDMKIPAGVMKEVDCAIIHNIPVFELPTILQSQKMTVVETREYLGYNGQR